MHGLSKKLTKTNKNRMEHMTAYGYRHVHLAVLPLNKLKHLTNQSECFTLRYGC